MGKFCFENMDALMKLQALVAKARNEAVSEACDTSLLTDLADAADAYIDETTHNDLDDYLAALDDFAEESGTSKLGLSPLSLTVTIAGINFPSLMHAFQAQKENYAQDYQGLTIPETDRLISAKMKTYASVDLQTANQKGRMINLDVDSWNEKRDNIMYMILSKCYEQNDSVQQILLKATGEIIEDCLPDEYWGGKTNKMGKTWMKLRDSVSTMKGEFSNKRRRSDDS